MSKYAVTVSSGRNILKKPSAVS